jgi:pimeloyl-ACP methyl ester carboxylesterase
VILKKFFLLTILLVCITACDSVFFYPTKAQVMSPDQIGVKYQPFEVSNDSEPKIYGWFLPAQGNAKATIIHLHGNAENISTHFVSIYWLPAENFNVVTFDYRGYGASEGRPSIEGVHRDAIRAIEYAKLNFSMKDGEAVPLFLFGQSLGASIALNVAARPEMLLFGASRAKNLQVLGSHTSFNTRSPGRFPRAMTR